MRGECVGACVILVIVGSYKHKACMPVARFIINIPLHYTTFESVHRHNGVTVCIECLGGRQYTQEDVDRCGQMAERCVLSAACTPCNTGGRPHRSGPVF